MRSALLIVVYLAFGFGALFAIGGAGIYGSPWGGKTATNVIFLCAIAAGPFAAVTALSQLKNAPFVSGIMLVGGAVGGILMGLIVDTDFREVWGKVFLVAVWTPMLVIGIMLLLKRNP